MEASLASEVDLFRLTHAPPVAGDISHLSTFLLNWQMNISPAPRIRFGRRNFMKETKIARITLVVALSLAALLLFCGSAVAQTQIQGVIDGRSGATMTVKTQDGTNVVVLLSDSTQVEEVEGGLKMRKKTMGMTALIPGLPVEVKGSTNAQNQLAADSVKFKGSDLKTAQDMQASMAPIKAAEAAQAA